MKFNACLQMFGGVLLGTLLLTGVLAVRMTPVLRILPVQHASSAQPVLGAAR